MRILLFAAAVTCGLSTPGAAAQYTIRDLGLGCAYGINSDGVVVGRNGEGGVIWRPDGSVNPVLGPTGNPVYSCRDINDSGQIIGWASWGQFRWSPTTGFTVLNSGIRVDAFSINNMGEVVGDGDAYIGGCVAQYWSANGERITLSDHTCNSRALDINDAGLSAGWYVDGSGDMHACLWDRPPHPSTNTLRDLSGYFASHVSQASAINNSGRVVGQLQATDGDHGFVFDLPSSTYPSGRLTDLGLSYTTCDVNITGQVVGYRLDRQAGVHELASVWDCGQAVDLCILPGFTDSCANRISDTGEIIGWATDGAGHDHAVVWTPVVPEPSSLLALLCCLGGLALWLRKPK